MKKAEIIQYFFTDGFFKTNRIIRRNLQRGRRNFPGLSATRFRELSLRRINGQLEGGNPFTLTQFHRRSFIYSGLMKRFHPEQSNKTFSNFAEFNALHISGSAAVPTYFTLGLLRRRRAERKARLTRSSELERASLEHFKSGVWIPGGWGNAGCIGAAGSSWVLFR